MGSLVDAARDQRLRHRVGDGEVEAQGDGGPFPGRENRCVHGQGASVTDRNNQREWIVQNALAQGDRVGFVETVPRGRGGH